MRKFIIFVTMLIASAGVLAQSNSGTLVSLLEAGDFRALTITRDERDLLVADAATNQVRVYDLQNPAEPALVASINTDGVPNDVASGRGLALVLTSAEGNASTIEVIAPDRYNPSEAFVGGINYIDLPFQTTQLAISSDGSYAMALGSDQYALMQLRSAGEIDARVFATNADLATLGDNVFVYAAGSTLVSASLSGLGEPEETTSREFNSAITAITIRMDGDVGAVGLANGQIELFAPDTLETVASGEVSTVPQLLQFGTADGETRLAVVARGGRGIEVVDASGALLEQLNFININSMSDIRSFTAFGEFLAATDGSSIAIFALS